MSLRSRLNRLEKALGDAGHPKMVVISTATTRHEIQWSDPWYLTLGVPWRDAYRDDPRAEPMEALTAEQRRLVRDQDKVVIICCSPDERGPERSLDCL
jgi:hypothetical protein